jgi:tRNA pseudouridine38-40 synthase
VRCLVGTLVRVGQGKFSPAEVRALREARARAACPMVAPARGLCLVRVSYSGIRAHAPRKGAQQQQEDTTDI